MKYIWDANAGDDVEEITECKDSHQVVEIVPLGSEPEDEAGVSNYAQNTKQDLGGEESSRVVKRERNMVMSWLGKGKN